MLNGDHRDLFPDQLRAAVAALARTEQVSDFVVETGRRRAYRELFRNEHLSAWVIRWGESADTGFHDHDVSAGAVHVVDGHVCEERLGLGGESRVRTYGPGDSFAFEAADIHRVSHAGDGPALTVHLYSPPLYEEELRPLTPA